MSKKTVSQFWEDIFYDYNILEMIDRNGIFTITADQISKYKEPRLMAKFDFSKQVPAIFKKNNLGILPIKNGIYIIGKFKLYQKIHKLDYQNVLIERVKLPKGIHTIDPDNIYSESNALNVALISGMLEATIGEKLYETIQGKMRTGDFNFRVCTENETTEIHVSGVGIEIDGGYESQTKVVLIEAKNSLPDDFIIRQLYYPYRHWNNKISKQIIPVFLSYDNGVYTIFIYKFEDENNYNSLSLVKVKRFMLEDESSEMIKSRIFNGISIIEDENTKIPFPQANSFIKVLSLLSMVDEGKNTPQLIAEEFQFEPRQGKYYLDAGRYLNAIESAGKGKYKLTEFGIKLLNIDAYERNKMIVKEMLSHPVFYSAFKHYSEKNMIPNDKEIIKIIKDSTHSNLSDNVILRRAGTVVSWLRWLIGCQV